MAKNSIRSGKSVASKASKVLQGPHSPTIKSVAASALVNRKKK